MKSFARLFVVLVVTIPSLAFSDGAVHFANTNSEAAVGAQIRDITTMAAPMNPDVPGLWRDPSSRDVHNTHIRQTLAYAPARVPYFSPPTKYRLTISSTSGGSVTTPGEGSFLYDRGTVVSVEATPEPNYRFVNWTGSAVDYGKVPDPNSATTTVIVYRDLTLQANFTIIQRTLTISSADGGSVSVPGEGSFLYDQGTDVSIEADPNVHWQVDTWYVDGNDIQTGGTTYTISNIQADHTVYVTFKKIQFTITPASSWECKNGWISPASPVIVNYGGSQLFTAHPNGGYEVDTWFVDGEQVQIGGITYMLSNIQADHKVLVKFKQVQYTLTTSSPWECVNGWISPLEPVTVNFGDSQLFTAYPNGGYKVDTWFVDGEQVQIGGTTYMLSNIDADHKIHATFRKALAYSLGSIDFEDDEGFAQIGNNNFTDPDNPEYNRNHVKRDAERGVMLMQNLMNLDQDSPDFGQMVQARAKAPFIGTGLDKVLIQLKYLFNTSDPGVELVVYLSDTPLLYDPDDPLHALHSLEVARIPVPPAFWPGSVESGRFAIFEKIVSTGHLDVTNDFWIELKLFVPQIGELLFAGPMTTESAGSEDTSVMVDSLSLSIQCYGICLDINWDNFVNEADFMMVIGGCGCAATGEMACMDGAFSADGYMDTYDVASWDWALASEDHLLNYCALPLTAGGMTMMSAAVASFKSSDMPLLLESLPSDLSDLLIAGKRGTTDASSKLKDCLYVFDSDGLCGGWFEPASDRCNIRLLQGPDGEVYQLNSETGLLQLDSTNGVIIPPGKVELTDIKEPRYNKSATVYVGIQDEGPDSFGRPILDAAFDADHVYIIPAVVDPDGGEPYTAAAKLKLLDEGNPPYEVVKLYDDPPLLHDNQYRNSLREIELDSAGNLYVLNVHSLNESDILWRYYPDGTIERVDLGRPDTSSYLPAPVGMHMSKTADMLYLTSAAYDPVDANSTVIHGFSTEGDLALERSLTISGLHHVTGITEDPQTGTLWVAGFNMYDVPQYPDPTQLAFYYPYVAKIPYDGNNIQLIPLFDPDSHDLALPMSIVWTGAVAQGGVDLDHSGDVTFSDFAILAGYWLDSNCAPPDWCDNADLDKSRTVDMADLVALTQSWLETGLPDLQLDNGESSL